MTRVYGELQIQHPPIPLYKIQVQAGNGTIRHIAYFSDKSCARRCFTCMQKYYDLFLAHRPKITLLPFIWWTTDNGTGYSNNGSYVIDDIFTRAHASDAFLQRNGCRDVDVIVHMFGEKTEKELGGVLRRFFASNKTFNATRYTIR